MSDELPKKVFSVPPPPTDEIDSEWGSKGADDTGKTATQAAEAGKAVASDTAAPAAAHLATELAGQGETAAAPSTPAKALPPSDADEGDEDDEDDEEDDDGDDGVVVHRTAHGAHASSKTLAASDGDWLPDWAPWAFLALLVLVGVIGGLTGGMGLFGSAPAGATGEPGHESAKEK